jgi:hypothetical protein
LDSLVE